MRFLCFVSACLISLGTLSSANAGVLLSPTSAGSLAGTGVTDVGGIVLDLVGSNGTRVVSQLSASSLFEGNLNISPGEIGTQTGFDNSVTGQLGGGITEAAVRITLFDGDSASGNFDDGDNELLVNGVNFGNFSDVATTQTNSTGTTVINTATGFRNNILDTGFFFSNDATDLTTLFNAIVSSEGIQFEITDLDPGENFLDFTAGVDGGLIGVGQGPSVTPGGGVVPEPGSAAIWSLICLGAVGLKRRRVAS